MATIAKWALLVGGAILIIGLIVSLPFMDFIDAGEFGSMITSLVDIAGSGFVFARGLLNNFLTPFGRTALTGLIYWIFGKWAITISIKLVVWIYHFIFKG